MPRSFFFHSKKKEEEGCCNRPWARHGHWTSQCPQYAFKVSMLICPAVHIPTRSLLRSSSTPEPSDPLCSVVILTTIASLSRKAVSQLTSKKEIDTVKISLHRGGEQHFLRVNPVLKSRPFFFFPREAKNALSFSSAQHLSCKRKKEKRTTWADRGIIERARGLDSPTRPPCRGASTKSRQARKMGKQTFALIFFSWRQKKTKQNQDFAKKSFFPSENGKKLTSLMILLQVHLQ